MSDIWAGAPWSNLLFASTSVQDGLLDLSTSHLSIGATSIGGLFGWWRFEADGYDSTNLMHPATLIGSAVASGGHLTLDGGGHATVSDNPFDVGLASFSVVVRAKSFGAGGSILSKRNNSSYRGWSLALADGGFAVEASDTGDLPFYGVAGLIPLPDTEYHLVVVFNRENSTLYLYIDGILQGTSDISGLGPMDNTIPLSFGAEIGLASWLGTLRDVRFYRRAISGAEVAVLAGGGDLYGDVPVFGTFIPPVYNGMSTPTSPHPLLQSPIKVYVGHAELGSGHPAMSASGRFLGEKSSLNIISWVVNSRILEVEV